MEVPITSDEILEIINSNEKVTVKEKMLARYKEKIEAELKQAQEEIYRNYRYCKKCGEYYRANTFEFRVVKEIRNVRTFHDLAEWGEDKYEDKECIIDTYTCPMGHKEEEKIIW